MNTNTVRISAPIVHEVLRAWLETSDAPICDMETKDIRFLLDVRAVTEAIYVGTPIDITLVKQTLSKLIVNQRDLAEDELGQYGTIFYADHMRTRKVDKRDLECAIAQFVYVWAMEHLINILDNRKYFENVVRTENADNYNIIVMWED